MAKVETVALLTTNQKHFLNNFQVRRKLQLLQRDSDIKTNKQTKKQNMTPPIQRHKAGPRTPSVQGSFIQTSVLLQYDVHLTRDNISAVSAHEFGNLI